MLRGNEDKHSLMIPLKLSLRNFMSYRENVPVLDLEGIHVACLCGDNGHGKSALLDAITWALWGQARAKSDDDLIHHTQTEMEVELEFQSGSERYRVLRKRAKGKRPGQAGQSMLDLQVNNAGHWRSIAGNGLRETQQGIINLLRLDYETFINSALLLQGRADEFTARRPAERKDVLASILGLSLYERLEEKAKERAKTREDEESRLQRSIEDLGRELERKPEYESEVSRARTDMDALEAERQARESVAAGLRLRVKDLEFKRQELAQSEARMAQEEKERRYWEDQADQHLKRLKAIREALAQQDEVETGYAGLVALRKTSEELGRKAQSLLALGRRRAALQSALDKARNDVVLQEARARDELGRLEKQAAQADDIQKARGQAAERLDALARRHEEFLAGRERLGELALRLQSLRSDQSRLREEIADLQNKLSLLDSEGAKCPVCQQDLSEADRGRLRHDFQIQVRQRQQATAEAAAAMTRTEKDRKSSEAALAQEEAASRRDTALAQGQMAAAERDLSQAQEAGSQAQDARVRWNALKARLQAEDFAHGERESLAKVDAEIAALAYDEAEHQTAQGRLQELAPYEARWQRLKRAQELLPQEEVALSQAQQQAAQRVASVRSLTEGVAALKEQTRGLPEASAQLSQAEVDLKSILAQREAASRRLGAAQAQLERCQSLEQARASHEKALRQASQERGIYDELALAFSHRGIPALIIESVLPEMEAEANRLLSRMTGGRMFLKLEATRPRKAGKGEPIETLDILISDELGTRGYEMFSGGEAFRINLAVRIALSRLLARRAGAPLPILVIDEGFGTQDVAGRDAIVEAITSIQDDFEKVLVITHIEELKDAFPVRIEVTKTEAGSTFTIT